MNQEGIVTSVMRSISIPGARSDIVFANEIAADVLAPLLVSRVHFVSIMDGPGLDARGPGLSALGGE